VLFVTVNVPGSSNNFGPGPLPGAEFLQRGKAVHAWLAESFARARKEGLPAVVIAMQADPDFEAFSAGRQVLAYQELLLQLVAESRHFAGEVVLLHGDSHWQRIDKPLRDPASGLTVANFTRVETYGSPFMGWVRISVTPGGQPLFRFEARPYQPRPD
jgi:hypothetical protein